VLGVVALARELVLVLLDLTLLLRPRFVGFALFLPPDLLGVGGVLRARACISAALACASAALVRSCSVDSAMTCEVL